MTDAAKQRLNDAIDAACELATETGDMVLVIRAGRDPDDVGYSLGGHGGPDAFRAITRAIAWTIRSLKLKVSGDDTTS
ncbi:MAG: hypothetical protein GTN69_10605 [Armatimonadetes bacterium]|nr:hypothetical protein [Armatimonadota bacterium]